jgi:hypothetical protein
LLIIQENKYGGFDQPSDALFVYLSPESFIPKDHPLRPIRQMVDTALDSLSPVLSPDVLPYWQAFYSSGAVAQSHVTSGALLDSQ